MEKNTVAGTGIVDITTVDSLTVPGAEVVIIGDDNSADLKCFGDRYVGAIEKPPQALSAKASAATVSRFGGLRMGEKLAGPVVRPDLVKKMPNEPNAPILRFTMIGGARQATPLMCERIRESIESAKIIQAVYADLDLVKKAEQQGLAASNPGYKAYPSLDDSSTSYDSAPTGSYHELVRAKYREELTKKGLNSPASSNVLMGGALGSAQFDPKGKGIAATHPISCKIYDALPINKDGTCRMEVELEAIRKHEESHSKRCHMMNDTSILTDAYFKWSNHPSNLSLDEMEAYQAALDILEPWFDTFCGG